MDLFTLAMLAEDYDANHKDTSSGQIGFNSVDAFHAWLHEDDDDEDEDDEDED